jgi:heterokaryon incompatibility protein (HET)
MYIYIASFLLVRLETGTGPLVSPGPCVLSFNLVSTDVSQPRRTNMFKYIPFKFTGVLSKSNSQNVRRMRLLRGNNTGEFSLTKDLLVSDNIPRYAILSHTWGADTEEVSFKDMMDGTGKRKTGYEKIRFCAEQAGRDGLQFFWIDTCCIDKSSSAELQEAINSMFRWYRDAAKCYVYLADVSRPTLGTDVKSSQLPWELSLRKSRWFTRGWTLQELVAPAVVEFFSEEGEQLGNKKSLERHIHEVTGIPVKALRGSPLSDFSIPERMLWAEKRETTRKEDKAYSLLGIFDVYMPLIYGEGRENAFKRLREEMDKASKGKYMPSRRLHSYGMKVID